MTTKRFNLKNPILNADSYKLSHYTQLPPGATRLSSYGESRGGKFNELVFLGMQPLIRDVLMKPITQSNIDEAVEFAAAHGVPFHKEGWEYILANFGGYMPVVVQALPEGTVVPTRVPMFQVVNENGLSEEVFSWCESYLETMVLRAIWYPTTVASLSREVKRMIRNALVTTQGNDEGLDFKLHDFGARGVSSSESAALGGMAHLVNFMGTDTMSGILAANHYYGATISPELCPGYSIPAMEHSTVTSWGQEREKEAYENFIDTYITEGKMGAIVIDSWDAIGAIRNIFGDPLKDKIINSGGTLVFRPDSGVPEEMVIQVLQALEEVFGVEVNENGFKVLPSYARVIQGDGVNYESIFRILSAMIVNGYCIGNIAFGMGGKLLQGIDRDTQKFAMKASAVEIDGVWNDVYKDPITDPGKASKKGRQAVIRNDKGVLEAVREDELGDRENLLKVVWRLCPTHMDIPVFNETSWCEVKARAVLPPLEKGEYLASESLEL